MKTERLHEILDTHIEMYLNNIALELEKNHNNWFDNFGFPIFGEISKEYHEQVYFQSYLESYTRQLINGILREVFEEEVADSIIWPEFDIIGIYNGYTNIEYEREYGYEFINCNKKVGYRYSYFDYEEIDSLLKKGKVDGIVLVEWQENDEIINFEFGDDRVRVINLWLFFHEMLANHDEGEIKKLYNLFTKEVKSAVEKADIMISLTTLPGYTQSYRYKTRSTVLHNMRSDIRNLTCYQVNDNDYRFVESASKQILNTYRLSQVFLDREYENAFVGTSDFAKCYLTSEYLFHYFKDNPMFDYTPIVSGYLKSIEQLLHVLFRRYFDVNNIQADLSDYTLGTYTNDINDSRVRFFSRELLPMKHTIVKCLINYRKECRNKLFHKDYFNSWSRVTQIRNNTLFLYVVILGAVDVSLIMDAPSVLGIIDYKYDQLFTILNEHNDSEYFFQLEGKEYTRMKMISRNKGLMFDKDGRIMNTIVFKHSSDERYETLEISRTRMPSEMWISSTYGRTKIWPME